MKLLPTADPVNVDDVYYGKASACHLTCTSGLDPNQRSTFREVQHPSRIEKCPDCAQEINLNTGSHCIVTIASQEWIALVATCRSCNSSAPKCQRSSPNKSPSPTGSCFEGNLLMYILRPADMNTAAASDTTSDTTASDTANGTTSADTSPDVSTAMANLSINPPPPPPPPPVHRCQCSISNCAPRLPYQCGCVNRRIACSDGCRCEGNCDNPNNVTEA